MSIYAASGVAAFGNLRKNAAGRWRNVSDGANAGRVGGPAFLPRLDPGFKIDPSRPIFGIGSCFAQNVQSALASTRRFKLVTYFNDPPRRDLFLNSSGDFSPLGFLHRYNPPSIWQELDRLFNDGSALNESALLFRRNDEIRDFHYHEHFPTRNIDDGLRRRAYLRDRFSEIRHAGLLVITLGLTESWFDHELQLYLNTTPNYAMVTGSENRFEFRVLDYQTVCDYLDRIVALVRGHVPDINIVITVSPVTLDATFTQHDVAVSTMHSKATLLAAARSISYRYPLVDYFPSYEMAMLSARDEVWAADQRHIRQEFVNKIMAHFIAAYVDA